ncbi:MAG: hypothetical protein WCK35_19170 [Chloroflexota bacterium]
MKTTTTTTQAETPANTAFDFSTLPLSPEFADILLSQVAKVLGDCLDKLNVPADVLGLAVDLYDLAYYQEHCYHNQEVLTGINPFEIDVTVIINHLANVGSQFSNYSGNSFPRPGTLLSEETTL